MTQKQVRIIGAGLAGSEAALVLARAGVRVELVEMRPATQTDVHKSGLCAELVCSNSLKSTKEASAAGMLKAELAALDSPLYNMALKCRVPAGGALAVDRQLFAQEVTRAIENNPLINLVHREATSVAAECAGATDADVSAHGSVRVGAGAGENMGAGAESLAVSALILATGPLTTNDFAQSLRDITQSENLFFYDAAAPIVMADSLDYEKLFWQSRYEDASTSAGVSAGTGNAGVSADAAGEGASAESCTDGALQQKGEYLNAPFSKDEYDAFIEGLTGAQKVIAKDFETKELFQACQPIEEIARSGHDAPRFGPLKPVGLTDPRTNKRPWAALQLRAEDANAQCFNLVGFQTNLTFPEQKRVFRMIPGLEHAEFARLGVMHKNAFINAPQLLGEDLRLRVCNANGATSTEMESDAADAKDTSSMEGTRDTGATKCASALNTPLYIAGQLSGTEGYVEAIRSGAHAAFSVLAQLRNVRAVLLPHTTAFGALLKYACNPETKNYQPMHVNFGIMKPLDPPVKQKKLRYAAYAQRGGLAMSEYVNNLKGAGLL